MKKILIVILILVIISTSLLFYLARKYPTTSPLKSSIYYFEHLANPRVNMKKEMYGFLPYWQIDKVENVKFNYLTEVNYFGLRVDSHGEIVKEVEGQKDEGFVGWENQKLKDLIAKTQINGGKFTVTIVSQRNSTIETLLDKPDVQEKLIANVLDLVKSSNLDGVNVDFEYTGDADKKYRKEFTEFSKRLNEAFKKENPSLSLELSIMPQSVRSKDIFDFPSLTPFYNKFIGMSYDFYPGASVVAGPIAPMTGFSENKYLFDVTTMYNDFLKFIPREKVLMGVPYYGWDWAVEDGKKIQSTTFLQTDDTNSPAVMSYARAKEFKNFKKNQCFFDDYALEPWCWYTDPKTNIDHQIWFENNKSIGIKFDFANKQNFQGIAIWVLGYDKNYPDLWNLMKEKFAEK